MKGRVEDEAGSVGLGVRVQSSIGELSMAFQQQDDMCEACFGNIYGEKR